MRKSTKEKSTNERSPNTISSNFKKSQNEIGIFKSNLTRLTYPTYPGLYTQYCTRLVDSSIVVGICGHRCKGKSIAQP